MKRFSIPPREERERHSHTMSAYRELLEYVGFIYTKWEKINTDFLPFGSSIYGNICFDNVLLCLDFYITHIAFFFFCSQGSERHFFPTRGKSTKKSGSVG